MPFVVFRLMREGGIPVPAIQIALGVAMRMKPAHERVPPVLVPATISHAIAVLRHIAHSARASTPHHARRNGMRSLQSLTISRSRQRLVEGLRRHRVLARRVLGRMNCLALSSLEHLADLGVMLCPVEVRVGFMRRMRRERRGNDGDGGCHTESSGRYWFRRTVLHRRGLLHSHRRADGLQDHGDGLSEDSRLCDLRLLGGTVAHTGHDAGDWRVGVVVLWGMVLVVRSTDVGHDPRRRILLGHSLAKALLIWLLVRLLPLLVLRWARHNHIAWPRSRVLLLLGLCVGTLVRIDFRREIGLIRHGRLAQHGLGNGVDRIDRNRRFVAHPALGFLPRLNPSA